MFGCPRNRVNFITPQLLDQLLANYEKPEDLTGEDGLFKQLKKALIERALGAELTEHLGYEKGDPAGRGSGNSRNGSSAPAPPRAPHR
jgi:transposase-like protein